LKPGRPTGTGSFIVRRSTKRNRPPLYGGVFNLRISMNYEEMTLQDMYAREDFLNEKMKGLKEDSDRHEKEYRAQLKKKQYCDEVISQRRCAMPKNSARTPTQSCRMCREIWQSCRKSFAREGTSAEVFFLLERNKRLEVAYSLVKVEKYEEYRK
jgi:hypothetical protein